MKSLPGGKTTYNEAYILNEEGNCGFYPVGQNNCWHSGVHFDLPSDSGVYPIYPLIDGKIVAYRATDTCEINYPKEVGKIDYNDLPISIKEYYRLYTTEESELKAKLEIYKLKDDRPLKKYSNNFVLLKHSIIGHGYKNNNVSAFDFDFFTLYTNLRPFNDYQLKNDYAVFTTIKKNNPEKTPIVADWLFKVVEAQDDRIYKTNESNEIYPLSHFQDTRNDSFKPKYQVNYYDAKFENEPDKVIKIAKSHCDIISDKITIKSGNNDIYFYRDDISVLSNRIQEAVGTLKKNSIFEIAETFTNQWALDNDYVKVSLNRDLVETRIFEGWIDTTKCFIHDKYSPTIYYKEDEAKTKRVLYDISKEHFLNANSPAFKIVTFNEYMDKVYGTTKIDKDTVLEKDGNIITNIPENITTDKTPVFRSANDTDPYITASMSEYVIVLNSDYQLRDSSSDIIYNESYGFYLNNNKATVFKVNSYHFKNMKSFYDFNNIKRINDLNRINPNLQLPNEIDEVKDDNLIVLKFIKDKELFPDDWYVKIPPPSNEINDFKSIENMEYCKFYIVGYLNTTWMVNVNNFTFESGKKCRIKDSADDNFYEETSEKGILVYSNSGLDENGNPIGNAKAMLPIDTEFKVYNGKEIVDNGKVKSFYKLKDSNIEGYIYIKQTSNLNAKIIENTDTPPDDNIQTIPKIIPQDVSFQDIIGYGNIDIPGTQTQEISLFFKQEPDIDSGMEINRYVIEESTNIYELADYEPPKAFFPPLSSLSVNETKEINGRSAIKCTLKSLALHFRDTEVKELTTPEDRKNENIADNDTERYFKIISAPSKIWFYSYSITKEEDGNIAIKPLVDRFKDNWDDLEGLVFKFAYKGSGNTTVLHVDFSEIESNFETWLLCEEFSSHCTFDNDTNLVTFGWMGQNPTKRKEGIETYTDCPAYKKFIQNDRTTVWEGTLYSDIGIVNTFTALENNTDVKYLGIKVKERICYIKEADIDSCKDNLLDFNNHFTISDRDNDNDLFCDVKAEVLDIIDTDDATSTGIITSGELTTLFKNRTEDGYKETVEKLRRLILKHPLEFNKDLYENLEDTLNSKKLDTSQETIDLMKAEADKLCIWSGIKDIKGIDNQLNLWFAHPITFIEHLEKMELLAVYPYHKMDLEPRFRENPDPTSVKVNSNPGFAPASEVQCNVRFPHKDKTKRDRYWAELNCLYGYSKGYLNGTKFHTGIDLAGDTGTPIYSFITGTVWATTWDSTILEGQNRGYGKVMIIKSLTEDKLYLMSHLSDYNKKAGDPVYPDDIVAYVGNTGNSRGAHLHLEVILCDLEMDEVLVEGKNKLHGEGAGLDWNDNNFSKKVRKKNRRNPLDHSKE